MSLIDGTGVKLFPTEFVKNAIKAYTKSHGKAPSILGVSGDDFIDYMYSCSAGSAPSGLQMANSVSNPFLKNLGIDEMVVLEDLKEGEMELATGWKKKP